MKSLADLKMRYKLLLLLAFPLAGLLYFSGVQVVAKARQAREMKDLQTLVVMTIRISTLVDDLQQERGQSALYVGSKGAQAAPALKIQRAKTNKQLQAVRDSLKTLKSDEPAYAAFLRAWKDTSFALNQLPSIRNSVDSLSLPSPDLVNYYSDLDGALLNAMVPLSTASAETATTIQIIAYLRFLQLKENVDRERSILSDTFAADRFAPGMMEQFRRSIEAQNIYNGIFLTFASPTHVKFYRSKAAGSFVDETMRLRNIAQMRGDTGSFNVDPLVWYKLQSEKMSLLKQVEDRLSRDLSARAERLLTQAQMTLLLYVAATLLVILLAAILAYVIARSITSPLHRVVGVAQKIAAGDLKVEVPCQARDDEIGELAQTFSRMTDQLRVQIGDVSEGVNALTTSVGEISASTSELAASSSETASAVSETTTTVEEVRQTAQLSSQKARIVAESAQAAARTSDEGRHATEAMGQGVQRIRSQMNSIADSMIRLSEQSQAIGEIIEAVDDLAQQSNLLAVNAAIEAAKVGEQGKGFAVVAQEMKSLAEQSKQATQQVRGILGDIQKATSVAMMATEQGSKVVEAGVEQSARAGESILELANRIEEAAQAAAQIAASNQQQLVGMDQVATAMLSVRQASMQNVQSARQLEESARGLDNFGQRLKGLVEHYQV